MEIQIRRRRGLKRITLRVGIGGKVTVSAPLRVPQFFIEKFLKEKADWIESAKKQMQKKEAEQETRIKFPSFESSKARAKKLLLERARYWADQYGVKFERVSIKRAATRWGSCSSKGNLNFHYRLYFLPEELRDYVVVHEICHLLYMNHSRAFWKEVERSMPAWRTYKRQLQKFVL
ncbi:MAG: hypothetical protein A3B90_00580 [Candidatus Magasanikbacteria bacterium RIFCSPHIGHO2_02_FULL_41_13]|uniref:YgjP-like metallopeptidase domain-containing protein n=1 Tax=Candidatus Magasanikbacteria bacterium RIFCSPHIGHO2_02_FULL_41_13 TaxID=1798676 RepID=A0A1F6M643_9BACT|nr:MAG: hypothetical protein A3B90_00580 [Candidatus Magasanikbacteria bacterium RIFCSPHIGHO2_02_FULL_41_13]